MIGVLKKITLCRLGIRYTLSTDGARPHVPFPGMRWEDLGDGIKRWFCDASFGLLSHTNSTLTQMAERISRTQWGAMAQTLRTNAYFSMMVLDSYRLASRLSLLLHHPDVSRTLWFLTLIFVGLFALISVQVFYADSQHPVLISSLSSSGRDPRTRLNPLHVLTSVTPVVRIRKLLSPRLHAKWMWLECWAHDPWMDCFRQRGKSLQGFTDSHCLSCVFLVVSLASTYFTRGVQS